MKRVIETDREPVIDHKTETEKVQEVIDMIEDHTKKQETVKPKKSNRLIWVIITVVVIMIIAGLMYYANLRKQQDNASA